MLQTHNATRWVFQEQLQYLLRKSLEYFQQKRNDQNRYWLLQTIESTLKSDFYNHQKIKEELKKQLILISENKTTPFEAANYLLTIR